MAKKRTRNKMQKRIENELIISKKGLSEKELKRLPKADRKKLLKSIDRNEKQKAKREYNKTIIEEYNLSGKYTINGKEYTLSELAKLSPETVKAVAIKERNKRNRIARQDRYKQQLLDAGFDEAYAHKHSRSTSQKKVEEHIFKGDRTVYNARAWISVRWADVTGESNMSDAVDQYDDASTEEMISEIHRIMDDITEDGSADFGGVPIIIISEDFGSLKDQVSDAYKRGYNKKMVAESQMLLASNKWTLRGFANMMLSVLSRTSDKLKFEAYEKFEEYAHDYLPEIHKHIF